MIIKNYEEVIEKLKTKFVDYLEEHDINTKKPFLCLDPDHNDAHPSMGVVPQSDFTRANCFSCGAIADIFDAVQILEGKPKNGPQYIEDTVMYLANKYQIQMELKELTEEEKYRIECFNAYKESANYVATADSKKVSEEIERRGWKRQDCSNRLIGGVVSFQDYKDHMKGLGFAVSFMEQIDLLNEGIFNENALIFTICDSFGRPCGFSSKNLSFVKGEDGLKGRKYLNTSAKCPIYEKSKRLYNIHNTKSDKGTVYITEGCSDTEAMIQHGITNVIGIGGTSFTDYHAIELAKSNRSNVTIVADPDEAGMKAVDRIIEKLSEHRDFSIHVVALPTGLDPDDFLRERGTDEFDKLKRWSAFEWKLDSYDDRIDTVLIREDIVPIIAGEGSPIERERMICALSERIDISVEAIKEEVKQKLDETEKKQKKERDTIIKGLIADLRTSPNSWMLSISEAQNNLECVSEKHNEDSFSPAIYLSELEAIKEDQEKTEEVGSTSVFWQWREFQAAIDGNHEATLNVIGGGANCGKTAMMSNMALQLAQIPEDYDEDYFAIFHTIDDTVKQFTNRLITQLAIVKYKDITLNMVMKPSKFQQARIINEARVYAYQKFTSLVQQQKILVRGGEEKGAKTLAYADQMIKYGMKVTKNRPRCKVNYFLDNFHRLSDFQGLDERTRFKKLSNATKDLAKKYEIPIWATMEYNKTVGTGRPTNNSISESIAMEYDANLIMHLYNEMHVKNQLGEEPDVYFQRTDSNGRYYKAPRVEAIIGKNKLNSFKGSLWFDFHTDQSLMVPVSSSQVKEDLDRIKAEKEATGYGRTNNNNGNWQNRAA